jgi:hypothetical protein
MRLPQWMPIRTIEDGQPIFVGTATLVPSTRSSIFLSPSRSREWIGARLHASPKQGSLLATPDARLTAAYATAASATAAVDGQHTRPRALHSALANNFVSGRRVTYLPRPDGAAS